MTANPTPPSPSEPWHLDRKVPIALILALMAQAATAIWWASGIERRQDATIDAIERVNADNVTQGAQIEALRIATQNLAVAAATVGTQISALTQSLNEIRAEQRQIYELLRQMNGSYRTAP